MPEQDLFLNNRITKQSEVEIQLYNKAQGIRNRQTALVLWVSTQLQRVWFTSDSFPVHKQLEDAAVLVTDSWHPSAQLHVLLFRLPLHW